MCTSGGSSATASNPMQNVAPASFMPGAANGPHAATRAIAYAMLNRRMAAQSGGQLGNGSTGNRTLGAV